MSAFTADMLREAMHRVFAAPAVPAWQVRLVDGGHYVPRRRHSRRKNGGKESYHKRIAKKWERRYGREWVETLARGQVIAMRELGILILRKDDYRLVRDALKAVGS